MHAFLSYHYFSCIFQITFLVEMDFILCIKSTDDIHKILMYIRVWREITLQRCIQWLITENDISLHRTSYIGFCCKEAKWDSGLSLRSWVHPKKTPEEKKHCLMNSFIYVHEIRTKSPFYLWNECIWKLWAKQHAYISTHVNIFNQIFIHQCYMQNFMLKCQSFNLLHAQVY
jgi:hypothetical protein